MVSRDHAVGNQITFENGDNLRIYRNLLFERLEEPFWIHRDGDREIVLLPGDYHFNDWNMQFESSRGRRVYGNAGLRTGGFWSGTNHAIRAGIGYRYNMHVQGSLEWERNLADLPEGEFTTDLLGVRLDFAFSPLMFLQSFIQYNTVAKTVSSNIRYRFIHHPLSDLFIVYNELRGISGNALLDRAVSVKLTHLLNF